MMMLIAMLTVEMVSPTSLVPEVTSKDFSSGGGYTDGLSPIEVFWGQVLTRRIEPYSYWTLELDMRDSAYVNLNFSFPWGSNWALLFRKNALPSITQHDLMKIIKNGRIEHRNKIRHVRWAPSDGISNNRPITNSFTANATNTGSQSSSSSSSSRSGVGNANGHFSFSNHLGNLSGATLGSGSSSRRAGLIPPYLNLDMLHGRQKRDSYADQSVLVFSEYLESGKWFLRLFNDDLLDRKVSVLANIDKNAEVRCPQQCSGNGNCVYGKCHCFDGFGGVDCSISKISEVDYYEIFT